VKQYLTGVGTPVKYEPGKALYNSFYRKQTKIDNAKNVARIRNIHYPRNPKSSLLYIFPVSMKIG
jgi:hypothetical protein